MCSYPIPGTPNIVSHTASTQAPIRSYPLQPEPTIPGCERRLGAEVFSMPCPTGATFSSIYFCLLLRIPPSSTPRLRYPRSRPPSADPNLRFGCPENTLSCSGSLRNPPPVHRVLIVVYQKQHHISNFPLPEPTRAIQR